MDLLGRRMNLPPTRSSSTRLFFDCESTQNVDGPSRTMYSRDWRSALRTPPTYRIGNSTLRFNYYFIALVLACIVCAVFIFFGYVSGSKPSGSWFAKYADVPCKNVTPSVIASSTKPTNYDKTYPLTPPMSGRGIVTYRIAMVADLDTNSKLVRPEGATWRSYLKKGYLIYKPATREIKLKWDPGDPLPLESSYALKGRGMELSELVTFNGRLISCDDRTGLLYQLVDDKPIPWVILLDGNGHSTKGFKCEWATVKDGALYVGSMGKEWTTCNGEFENENPMFVKKISPSGQVASIDWSQNYKLIRQQSKMITWPGYMIHESGVWSDEHQKWFFLPRRCSKEKYNETRDEYMGCNVLISANESFTKVETVALDSSNTKPTHGFSSFKFIPGTADMVILAIKTEELNGKTSTFVTAFDIDGNTLLPEQKIESNYKYEGIEFI